VKLVAILLARNELDRYLRPCIASLQTYCDEIRVTDDGSDDDSVAWLSEQERVQVGALSPSQFWVHEGRTRNIALTYAFLSKGTHYISIDADEFIADGQHLRERIEHDPAQPVWTLEMEEVWNADADSLSVRVDGGWRPHPLPIAWRAPEHGQTFRMLDRKLACRRVPMQVLSQPATPSGTEILHLGWLDKTTRRARYDRYMQHDNGKFHASAHLRSIMFSDARVQLRKRGWPAGAVFDGLRERFEVTA
jgi:glycosyltransferase involved in cell wall biosynthesis